MFLERISYPEVEAYLRKSQTILLPVGSLENHGKHMPLGTDTLIPEHLCSLLDARFPELLIAPPLHYGATEDLRGFPGTISIGVEGLRMLLTLIVDQLFDYGFRRFIILNGHGGNTSSLNVVINSLKYSYGIDAYYSGMGFGVFDDAVNPELGWSEKRGHASESETSQCLAICPECVRKDNLQKGEVVENFVIRGKNNPFRYGGIAFQWERDASRNGALGDARKSSKEEGERLNNVALERVSRMIEYILEHY